MREPALFVPPERWMRSAHTGKSALQSARFPQSAAMAQLSIIAHARSVPHSAMDPGQAWQPHDVVQSRLEFGQ
jgi:hypothetical protein